MVYHRGQRLKLLLGVSIATFLLYSSGPTLNAMGQGGTQEIRLPPPSFDGSMSVEAAIRHRRSIRDFKASPLSLATISQLLWSAQGITSPDGHRTAPSAGALYPLEIYLVAGEVQGLSSGVYRYEPGEHRLMPVAMGDRRRQLSAAALNQTWMARAPAIVVITGIVERTARKYGERALRYVQIEAGHVAQNVYLQATAEDLGTVLVGAFHDARVSETLGLPEDHAPLCLMPVGSFE